MARLITKTQVRLKPKALSIIPVRAVSPLNINVIKTMDVMGYPNFYMEHPDVVIVPTTHSKLNKRKLSDLILLVMNNSEEEQVLQKSITLGLGVKSRWKIRKRSYQKVGDYLHVNTIQREDVTPINPCKVEKSLEDTVFVGRHNTYTKPWVDLADVQVPDSIKEAFKDLQKEFEDIVSQHASDIGVTDLAEMTIDTKPSSIPHASRPYKLVLQHQEFLRKEIQALLDTKVIILSISKYVAPCMVVGRKNNDAKAGIRERHRLVINYQALNRTLEPIVCDKPNANGMLALVPQLKIGNMWSVLK